MNIFLWLILLTTIFLSIRLMIRLQSINKFKKYRFFRYLSFVIVAWSLVTLLRQVVIEEFLIYQLTFLVYPLVFMITSYLYFTIKLYLDHETKKALALFMIGFFILDFGLSMTNMFHHLLLDINLVPGITTASFSTATIGPFFYIHTIVCYILLFLGFYDLLVDFMKNFKKEKDIYPFLLVSISIIFGIIMNIIHIFFSPFIIDPTYIFIVIAATIMFDIFKSRDLNLIIDANRNRDILSRIREMYIISDQRGIVVDCSDNMKENYPEIMHEEIKLAEVKKLLEMKAILFKTDDQLPNEFDPEKRYFNIKEQRIKMPHFKYFGKMTLLYDETSDIKLISEMDRIMSHDLMTGLYNRNYFENQIPIIENEVKKFGLIIFDMDGLKLHNDYLGHKSGDELLINFSNMLLKACMRDSGLTPIRMGGDEFLLISKNGDDDYLQLIAKSLTEEGHDDDPIKQVNFSYGIASRKTVSMKFSTVLKEADANLYHMKESKKEQKEQVEAYFKKIEKSAIKN